MGYGTVCQPPTTNKKQRGCEKYMKLKLLLPGVKPDQIQIPKNA